MPMSQCLTLTDTQFLPVHGQTVKLEKEVVMKLLIYDGVAIFPLCKLVNK